MGIFKKIGKAIGGAVKGVVKTVAGAGKNIIEGDIKGLINDTVSGVTGTVAGVFGGNAASGLGSSDGTGEKQQLAFLTLVTQIQAKLDAEFRAKFGKKPDVNERADFRTTAYAIAGSSESKPLLDKIYAELTAGNHVEGTTVKSTIGQALDGILKSVAESVGKGLGGFVETGIGKGSEAVFGSKPAKSLQETLSGWFGGVVDGTLKDWLKRNWIFVIIPFGFIAYAVYRLLFNSTGSKKGGKSKGFRTK